jgi:excisionase family DNA binding protein
LFLANISPEVFTVSGAAQFLGVSKRTVEEYIAQGKLHTYRLPHPKTEGEYLRRTLIHIDDLRKLIRMGVSL